MAQIQDAKQSDDLEAVRVICEALHPFEPPTQQRILRWVIERIGLQSSVIEREQRAMGDEPVAAEPISSQPTTPPALTDIKSFVAEKKPRSDNEFAATVAYYYRFVAPEPERKEAITAQDLQEACRLVGRVRMSRPGQTLINAHHRGLLDKPGDPGAYTVSTVGENLVAVTLPAEGGRAAAPNSQKRPSLNRKRTIATRGRTQRRKTGKGRKT